MQLQTKKLSSNVPQQALVHGNDATKRLFIFDNHASKWFLIDSGADYSVLAADGALRSNYNNNKNDDDTFRLYAANGSQIHTYGTKLVDIELGLRRHFQWRFVIADVSTSIIGADFLHEFGLMIDVRGKRLIDRTTNLTAAGTLKSTAVPQVSFFDANHDFAFLLAEFKELLDDKPSKKVKDIANVTHHITTTGPPVTARVRQLPKIKLEAARKEFNELLRLGICQPSKSNYASPLHLVRKANGEWRPCGDYRRLNASTVPDCYPVPLLRDFQNICYGMTIFTRIDLRKAFHQVPMAPADIPKTAIITPFGLFEFVYMTFGLRNAAQTFQRLIDEALRGLDFVFAFIDDIIIASSSHDQHTEHIRMVFQRLKDYGLRINAEKCEFAKTEIKFLGHLITKHGIRPLPEKIDTISKFSKPNLACELRRFLSMIQFYRRFIPNAAEVHSRLQVLINGNLKNDKTQIKWTDDALTAFDEYKAALSSAVSLAHPSKHAKLIVATDASATNIGGVVQQIENGTIVPLGFYSKRLQPREQKYPTYDRELLAIYRTIRHFQYLLEGREFEVLCDHKPLSFAFTKKPQHEIPRRIEQLYYISQFTTKTPSWPGKTTSSRTCYRGSNK